MSKNKKGQLVAIILLICCTFVLLGAAIALAVSGASNDTPKDSNSAEWTQNY